MNPTAQTPLTAARRLTPDSRDRESNFHGKSLLYVLWEQHLIVCAPIVLPVDPDMPFGQLLHEVLPRTVFARHPQWAQIDWSEVVWRLDDQPFVPQADLGLARQGLTHKALLRLRTPGLEGLGGVYA